MRLMTETRTPYKTGSEADYIKRSAMLDLMRAVQQYEEAGGEVKLTNTLPDGKTVLLLDDIRISDWRRMR